LGQTATALFYGTVLLVPTWVVGRLTRRHSDRTTAFRELAAQVDTEQGARDAAAIAEMNVDVLAASSRTSSPTASARW
jgi:hypothetical protein